MSLFPFISPDALEKPQEPLPLFQEYAYDFEQNRLLLRDGQTYLVQGNEALEIWIHKALFTERFRYLAYDADYGSELDTLKGSPISDEITQSEVKRMIIEAPMCNPYIEELSGFAFETDRRRLTVRFDCRTVYGRITIDGRRQTDEL